NRQLNGQRSEVTFRFGMHFQTDDRLDFVATTADPGLIARARQQLQLAASDRLLHIDGGIVAAGPADNPGWSWRFIEDRWDLAEVSMEACDGNAEMVQQGLSYWLQELGRFCPWNSYVAGEVAGADAATGIIVRFTSDLGDDAFQQHVADIQQ